MTGSLGDRQGCKDADEEAKAIRQHVGRIREYGQTAIGSLHEVLRRATFTPAGSDPFIPGGSDPFSRLIQGNSHLPVCEASSYPLPYHEEAGECASDDELFQDCPVGSSPLGGAILNEARFSRKATSCKANTVDETHGSE